MKNLIYTSILSILCFASCKSDLEKIDLNNIDSHRAYQDSILKNSIISGDISNIYKKSDSIIFIYKNLKTDGKENNTNYY